MLTPGDAWLAVAGTGLEASKFWYAFFNPTLLAQPLSAHLRLHLAGRRLGAHRRQPHRRRPSARAQGQPGQVERQVALYPPSWLCLS